MPFMNSTIGAEETALSMACLTSVVRLRHMGVLQVLGTRKARVEGRIVEVEVRSSCDGISIRGVSGLEVRGQ